jgi:hypothetical protein
MLSTTAQLDRLEESLPPVSARVLRLQRNIARSTYDSLRGVVGAVAGAARSITGTARVSGRTVSGQARAASRDVASTVTADTKQVLGQTTAQARRISQTAKHETTRALDRSIRAVDPSPGSGKPYEQWTKAELLERAKELEIAGRYGLSKRQLIAALRAA